MKTHQPPAAPTYRGPSRHAQGLGLVRWLLIGWLVGWYWGRLKWVARLLLWFFLLPKRRTWDGRIRRPGVPPPLPDAARRSHRAGGAAPLGRRGQRPTVPAPRRPASSHSLRHRA